MSEVVSLVAERFISNAEFIKNFFPLLNFYSCLGCSAFLSLEKKYPDASMFKDIISTFSKKHHYSRHSNPSFPFVVSMLYTASDPVTAMRYLDETYGRLRKYFSKSPWTTLGAMVISRISLPQYSGYLCDRTFAVFSRLKALHPLLTDYRIIPFCALMSLSDLSDETLIAALELYMKLFSRLHISNEAVFSLSLVLSTSHYRPEAVAEKMFDYFVRLNEAGIQLGDCSALLGLVSMINVDPDLFIRSIIEADSVLADDHSFKFHISSNKYRLLFATLISFVSFVSDINDPVFKKLVINAVFCSIAVSVSFYSENK